MTVEVERKKKLGKSWRDSRRETTLFVLSGALGEEILAVRVEPVAVEVVRVEELGPELGLGHLGRHALQVLLLHRRVRAEDAGHQLRRQVVAQPVAAVGLRFDVGLRRRTCRNDEIVSQTLGRAFKTNGLQRRTEHNRGPQKISLNNSGSWWKGSQLKDGPTRKAEETPTSWRAAPPVSCALVMKGAACSAQNSSAVMTCSSTGLHQHNEWSDSSVNLAAAWRTALTNGGIGFLRRSNCVHRKLSEKRPSFDLVEISGVRLRPFLLYCVVMSGLLDCAYRTKMKNKTIENIDMRNDEEISIEHSACTW